MSNVIKRGVSIAVTTSTILWSVGLGFAPLATRAAQAGDLIKMAGNSAVYYLGSDGKRYVFPNDKSYFTWYSDFSGVVTVSQSELQSYQIGGNVTYRAGTRLVKITTDPKVYAVEPGGLLRWVTSESIATTLFGSNWASTVDDVSDAFFVNYTVGSSISSNTYPTGSLIKLASSSDVYYVDGSTKRMVTAAGFSANKLNSMYVRTADESVFNALGNGSQITGTESAIWNVSGGASGPVVGGSGLSVSLASDTPASTIQASGTAYNPALKLNLTAAADGAVNLTGLTLTRAGISVDSDISGVAIFDNTGMRHGNFVSFADTKAMIDFSSNPITVPAGQTVPVWVKTNILSTVQSGTYAVSVMSSSDVKTTAAVSGSFPVVGNGFSLISGSSSVGGLQVDVVNITTATVNVDVGTNNYLLGKFRFTAGANEPVSVSRVRMFNNGTADDDDLQNYTLRDPNGVALATVAKASNRYVDFVLTTPYQISEGNQRDLTVTVDVKDGSTRTAQLNVQNDYDVEVMGAETAAGILATAGPTTDTSFPVGDIATGNAGYNHLTVQQGSLTVNKSSTSPSGEIGVATPNSVIAIWDLEAKGEDIELQRVDLDLGGTAVAGDLTGTIKLQTEAGQTLVSFSPTSTDGAELFDGDAISSDSQTLSSYLTVKSGTTVKLKLIVDTDSDISSGDTISGGIGAIYFKRLLSNTYGTAASGAFISGNTLTTTTNSLTVSSNAAYASQTLTAGQSEVKVGSFLLKTNNAEGINISSIVVRLTAADAVGAADLSNLKIKRADTGVQIGSTIASPVVAAAANTFTTSGALNIPANSTVQIDIYASVSSGASDGGGNDTLVASLQASDVSGVGANSGANIPASAAATLQTLTFVQSGSLTVAIDQSGAASSQFYTTGLSGVEMARIKLSTTNEGTKLQKLELRSINGSGNIDSVKLMGTGLASDPVTSLTSGLATFTFSSGSEIVVPSNSSKVLTVVVNTTPLQSLVGGTLGVLGFNTADAIGSGSGVTVQESLTGTSYTAAADDGSEGAVVGSVVYTSVTTATGGITPGFYMVTTNGGGGAQGLTDNGLSLNATAATWATGDIVTLLTATSVEIDADADSDNALAVGDVVYFYGDVAGTDNSASTGWHVVTTASSANAASITLDGSAVAIDAGDGIARFANASTGNALVGNVMRFEEVEPVITLSASSPSGTTSPNSEQTVGVFNVKAEGGRDLSFNSVTVEKNGSNSPEQYVTKLSLWNGSTKLSEVLTTTVAGSYDDEANNGDTIDASVEFCTGATVGDVDEIGNMTAAEVATIAVGDKLTVVASGGADTDTTTNVTVIAKSGTLAACDGTVNGLEVTFDTAPTNDADDTTFTFRNNRVHFDANQAQTGDTALVEQTITAGQTMTLTVKADTSSVKTGVTSGTVTFGANIPGSNGPLQIGATQIEGFSWDYSPLNTNGTATYKTEADGYPIIGNTLSY